MRTDERGLSLLISAVARDFRLKPSFELPKPLQVSLHVATQSEEVAQACARDTVFAIVERVMAFLNAGKPTLELTLKVPGIDSVRLDPGPGGTVNVTFAATGMNQSDLQRLRVEFKRRGLRLGTLTWRRPTSPRPGQAGRACLPCP